MTRQAMGIDQKIVHGTEFHLVRVLIDAGKNLGQKCCKDFPLQRFGEPMGDNKTLLESYN
jgi:hypothetical protein